MSPNETDPGEVNVRWAYYGSNKSLAEGWVNAAGQGEVEPPIRGAYTENERDGHREIAYQADPALSELHCQTEMAPIPEPRALAPNAGDPVELWRTEYGPIALHARAYMGKTRVGEGTRKLWSFCHVGGWKGCVIIRNERLGDGLAEVFEGPEDERYINGKGGRKRKATPDECGNQSTAYYNNARNAVLGGMLEIWSSTISDSKEKYFTIQISPTAYVLPGGVHDLLRNEGSTDPRSRQLTNAAVWGRKYEDEVVGYQYLGWQPKALTVDATVEPDTIAATAEVTGFTVEGGTRWDLDPKDHPINIVTPIKEYFRVWDDNTQAMLASIWEIDFSANGLRGAVEFLIDDDQYACYEYATKDQWPQTEEFDEWRQNKAKLHRVHLEAGKEISMPDKVLQAIAILPDDARTSVAFDVREVLMRIVRFNLDVRGKYPYEYDLDAKT